MNLADPYVWIDPAEAVFARACREALALERRAYAAADAERKALRAQLAAREAVCLCGDPACRETRGDRA